MSFAGIKHVVVAVVVVVNGIELEEAISDLELERLLAL